MRGRKLEATHSVDAQIPQIRVFRPLDVLVAIGDDEESLLVKIDGVTVLKAVNCKDIRLNVAAARALLKEPEAQ